MTNTIKIAPGSASMSTSNSETELTIATAAEPMIDSATKKAAGRRKRSRSRRTASVDQYNLVIISGLPSRELNVKKNIPAILECVDKSDDNFLASFDRAGLVASGDSKEEATDGLCEIICDTFFYYSEHESKLGQESQRQLDILREHIQRV